MQIIIYIFFVFPFLFKSSLNPKMPLFIHRSSIRHWVKRARRPLSNKWFQIILSIWVFYIGWITNYSFWNHFATNVVVERVPYCAWTSNSLALTILMVSHYYYWSIENQDLPISHHEMLWFLHMIYSFIHK